MQGIVKDGNGGYVEAAIVSFRRLTVNTDPEDVSKDEAIYAQTDDEGNFIIENLDPEGKYIIDVLVEKIKLEAENKMSEIQPQRPEGKGTEPKTESETKTELKASPELKQEEKQEKELENEEEPGYEEEPEYEDENEYDEELKIEFADAGEPPYVEDRSNDYDESFYDIPKDPEVSETFAGNVIKPNKELEGKLYILKSNMW